jgi:hypothetical protein
VWLVPHVVQADVEMVLVRATAVAEDALEALVAQVAVQEV